MNIYISLHTVSARTCAQHGKAPLIVKLAKKNYEMLRIANCFSTNALFSVLIAQMPMYGCYSPHAFRPCYGVFNQKSCSKWFNISKYVVIWMLPSRQSRKFGDL